MAARALGRRRAQASPARRAGGTERCLITAGGEPQDECFAALMERAPTDADYMQRALELARAAQADGEVPVGALLVRDAAVIASGANRPISACDPTAHAEIEALRAGGRALGDYRLTGTTLYVTLEPCLMCAAAIVHARVRRVVFGAFDPQAGAAGSVFDAFRFAGQNHRVDVFGGVLAEECGTLLRGFFEQRRS